MSFERLIDSAARYYSERFAAHGAEPRGVDWNDEASQRLRFARLLDIVDDLDGPFSLTDYGCGYGALVAYLRERSPRSTYQGFDAASALLEHARSTWGDGDRVFVGSREELATTDYAVASGVFNVKLDHDAEVWTDYVVEELRTLYRLATRGFAFNMLTSYSDPERMRPDLYYANPRFFFDLCRREFSPHVALAHDYGLWEFTILVRRQPRA